MNKKYVLKLYVLGETANSQKAIRNLKELFEGELLDLYAIKIIDVLKNPQLAEDDKILATPTLIKTFPHPIRKIIGDLSDKEKVLLGLDLTYEERRKK